MSKEKTFLFPTTPERMAMTASVALDRLTHAMEGLSLRLSGWARRRRLARYESRYGSLDVARAHMFMDDAIGRLERSLG